MPPWIESLLPTGILLAVVAWFYSRDRARIDADRAADREAIDERLLAIERHIERSLRNEGEQGAHNRQADIDMGRILQRLEHVDQTMGDIRERIATVVKVDDCNRMHRELVASMRD